MKISVITAIYNNKTMIEDVLQSIFSQSYGFIEHIVIDGASTDGTTDVLKRFRSQFGAFLSEPDNGIYEALNKGIRLATGDVIGFLHSDDLFANEHTLSRVALAFEDPDIDAVYGDLIYVRNEDLISGVRYWRSGKFSRNLLKKGWMPPHPTFYARKSCYDRIGTFDTSYRIAADYEHMLRLLVSDTIRVKYIPEVLVKMRLGGISNRSLKNMIQKSREDYRALRSHQVGGFRSLILKNIRKLPQFLHTMT